MCVVLTLLGLCCCEGFSLVAVSWGGRGYSLTVVLGLLIAIALLVAEHSRWAARVSVVAGHGMSSCSSPALEHRLNSCGTQA